MQRVVKVLNKNTSNLFLTYLAHSYKIIQINLDGTNPGTFVTL
jgi:hypothetical protein